MQSTVSRLGPYITFCVLAAVCLPLSIFLPETRGQPLIDAYAPANYRAVAADKRTSTKL